MFLMKKSLLLLLSGLNGQRNNKKESQSDDSGLGRRYSDLTDIAKHYMPDFDERKVNLKENSKKFKFKFN